MKTQEPDGGWRCSAHSVDPERQQVHVDAGEHAKVQRLQVLQGDQGKVPRIRFGTPEQLIATLEEVGQALIEGRLGVERCGELRQLAAVARGLYKPGSKGSAEKQRKGKLFDFSLDASKKASG